MVESAGVEVTFNGMNSDLNLLKIFIAMLKTGYGNSNIFC
jgi:hypothetical protein